MRKLEWRESGCGKNGDGCCRLQNQESCLNYSGGSEAGEKENRSRDVKVMKITAPGNGRDKSQLAFAVKRNVNYLRQQILAVYILQLTGIILTSFGTYFSEFLDKFKALLLTCS